MGGDVVVSPATPVIVPEQFEDVSSSCTLSGFGLWTSSLEGSYADPGDWNCPTPTSSLNSPRELMGTSCGQSCFCEASGGLECPGDWNCPTPASSLSSPRELMGNSCGQSCFCEASGGPGSEMDRVLCYLTNCHCCLDPVESPSNASIEPDPEVFHAVSSLDRFPVLLGSPSPTQNAFVTNEMTAPRTKLTSKAAAYQPVNMAASQPMQTTDARTDAVVNAAHLALLSCGQLRTIKIEHGITGQSPTLIIAELSRGADAASRCYDVVHLAKQALEAITARLPTTALLSARMQKEDCGYSLRSNIACLPQGAENCMCWDTFHQGHCKRRSQCRWYHPQDSDISRIKVIVRYSELNDITGEEQLASSSLPEKHKISLGELV